MTLSMSLLRAALRVTTLLAMSACSPSLGPTPIPTLAPTPTPVPCASVNDTILDETQLPEFIEYVWPYPGLTLSTECFLKGDVPGSHREPSKIFLMIDGDIEPSFQDTDDKISSKVKLITDGQVANPTDYWEVVGEAVPTTPLDPQSPTIDVTSSYIFRWAPLLGPGKHVVTFTWTRESGEAFSYTWEFTLAP
jgi:hypothetical protein